MAVAKTPKKKPKKLGPRDFETPFSANPEEAKRLREEALHSVFMRVPGVRVELARGLLDLGFTQLYQIAGRAPETLWADLRAIRPEAPEDFLAGLRAAVNAAERG